MGICYCKSSENANNRSLNQSNRTGKYSKESLSEKPIPRPMLKNKIRPSSSSSGVQQEQSKRFV